MIETLEIPPTVHPKEYIQRLQDRGIPVERTAEWLGLSVRMVFHMKKFDHEPKWSIALKLIELNALHCSTASVQPSTFNPVQGVSFT